MVGGLAALQYLERRVAEMEMRCSGGNHYQGTQLHLEIVDVISICSSVNGSGAIFRQTGVFLKKCSSVSRLPHLLIRSV